MPFLLEAPAPHPRDDVLHDVGVAVAPVADETVLERDVVRDGDLVPVSLGDEPGDPVQALGVARHVEVGIRAVVGELVPEEVVLEHAAGLGQALDRGPLGDRPVRWHITVRARSVFTSRRTAMSSSGARSLRPGCTSKAAPVESLGPPGRAQDLALGRRQGPGAPHLADDAGANRGPVGTLEEIPADLLDDGVLRLRLELRRAVRRHVVRASHDDVEASRTRDGRQAFGVAADPDTGGVDDRRAAGLLVQHRLLDGHTDVAEAGIVDVGEAPYRIRPRRSTVRGRGRRRGGWPRAAPPASPWCR